MPTSTGHSTTTSVKATNLIDFKAIFRRYREAADPYRILRSGDIVRCELTLLPVYHLYWFVALPLKQSVVGAIRAIVPKRKIIFG